MQSSLDRENHRTTFSFTRSNLFSWISLCFRISISFFLSKYPALLTWPLSSMEFLRSSLSHDLREDQKIFFYSLLMKNPKAFHTKPIDFCSRGMKELAGWRSIRHKTQQLGLKFQGQILSLWPLPLHLWSIQKLNSYCQALTVSMHVHLKGAMISLLLLMASYFVPYFVPVMFSFLHIVVPNFKMWRIILLTCFNFLMQCVGT